jgi:hypothetical protein
MTLEVQDLQELDGRRLLRRKIEKKNVLVGIKTVLHLTKFLGIASCGDHTKTGKVETEYNKETLEQ